LAAQMMVERAMRSRAISAVAAKPQTASP